MIFEQYLTELKKIQLLEPAEEAALWQGYKADGDLNSRRKLIEHYQPLVFKITGRWRSESFTMDLIQEGTVGLIEAVESYDHTRGVAFSLFASHRIRGRILNFIEQEGNLDWARLDGPPADGSGSATLGDLLVDTAVDIPLEAEHNFVVEQVKLALNRLPAKEQLVMSGMFLDEREPKQLAQSLDISVSHLYRLQKQGVRRMRGLLSKLMHEMKG